MPAPAGAALAQLGYHQIVAMDMSRGMLQVSQKKNVYRDFHQMIMGEPLDFPAGAFDATISVGVFTVGHAPAKSLDDLVRVTRPGGYVVFSLRPDVYENDGFREKYASLESQGKWKLVELSEPFQPLPKGEPDVYHRVWVYQVIGQGPHSGPVPAST